MVDGIKHNVNNFQTTRKSNNFQTANSAANSIALLKCHSLKLNREPYESTTAIYN